MFTVTYILTFDFQTIVDIWKKSHHNFGQELHTSVEVDSAIKPELEKILLETNSNRVYIFRYHNGTPSPNNVPFIFFTNTYEIIQPGTNRLINLSQRLPASLIHDMNVEFTKDKCVSLNNLDKQPNGANYWIYQTRNSASTIRCPFFSKDGDLLGFIGVDYINNVADSVLKTSELLLHNSARTVTQIFDR